ncbi:MAG: hypothetical protein JKX75_00190 [Gammaproteobacteria bacterium]|nr:hypothetical protein [Gammaproteobacteria bacterium]
MIDSIIKNEHAGSFSRRQQLFVRYTFFVLIDLTVLNLFNEYWDNVYIEHFSISLLVAVLLQILLQLTIAIEHHVANIFKSNPDLKAKILRVFSTWTILFISKLIILGVINLAFGDSVLFNGPVHGVVTFIIVVIAIIIAEQIFLWIYRSLA